MTSGTGTCTVHANQAGNDNYNAAHEKTHDVTAEKADQTITINTGRTGDEGLQHLLHGRRQRQLRPRGQLQRLRRLQQRRRHLHDDERHRHLHRPLQPGRQRQLQRRAREDPGRHRTEGRPDDHDQHGAPATKVFNTSFTVAASASSGLAVSYSA